MLTEKRPWLYDLLLVLVLVIGTYFRVLGLNWDENQHLHPDERFLTMVESNLQVKKCLDPALPPESCPPDQRRWLGPADYFNTATSALNPHNRGFGFFVYGDLPIFIVRYAAELAGKGGYDQVHLIGRQLSALADLLTVLMIYLIAARLYNRKVALLAAAFSALAVMQIQQSHFFTVDNFANFFTFLVIYFAVEILQYRRPVQPETPAEESTPAAEAEVADGPRPFPNLLRDPIFRLSLGFGLALGMAVASKINAAPLAVLLPGALLLRARLDPLDREAWLKEEPILPFAYLAAGAMAALLAFRIFQPYAFSGLGLNPLWTANMRDLAAQSGGDVDVPFALQWARRSHLFSFKNLTLWGLGLPLGILAWAGFLTMGWRALKGEWRHLLLWGWTAIYFLWQSMAFNPTMRYQLPIYPLLCLMAAWLVFNLPTFKPAKARMLLAGVLGISVLILSAAWAYAFTRIYTQPHTRVAAARWIYQNVPGPINLHIQTGDGQYQQPLPFPQVATLPGTPNLISFTANASGDLTEIYFPHLGYVSPAPSMTLGVSVLAQPDAPPILAFGGDEITSGGEYILRLNQKVALIKGQIYFLRLETSSPLTLSGAAPINESDWDDGLPLRIDGYDGFGGLYNGGLNLQLYWDDNADKVARFSTTLDAGEYIFITSNRQWATITRVPERYPLTSAYYRALIGCPDDREILWCYNVARPGMFEGQLGYELVQVFESFPTLGPLRFNDQFAEEAFTVYDHPKVLIFKKAPGYSSAQVRKILEAVDLSHVVRLTPKQASKYKDLMLTPDQLIQQRAGGTWSQLFNYGWLQNRFPLLGLVLWYGFILLLGAVSYPIVRLVLPGLADKGYPLARTLGMVILAYGSWLGGSVGAGYSRPTIGVVFALLTAAGLGLGWARRGELAAEWRSGRKYFLLVEGLFLAFFLIDLFIRLGNPDLWHPAKGGERPMDFSYFNAILKSTSFPPYDPWFAGGYINYYYYGFVLVATPLKLLGIVPSIAYNFILPTLFAMVAVSAFSIVTALVGGDEPPGPRAATSLRANLPLLAGILAALLMVLLGNLGTIRMLYQGFERMAAPGGIIDSANIVQRMIWAVQGFYQSLLGAGLPYGRGDWYWFPSRVIPAPGDVEPITEFPFFTFLYSDLHAHMLVLPLTLFVVAWAVSTIRARRTSVVSLALGALVIGALKPTNTWDLYTYLPLAALALGYILFRYSDIQGTRFGIAPEVQRLGLAVLGMLALYALAVLFYQPFSAWYLQGYGKVQRWTGTHTPIWSYFTHWGIFLFMIVFWVAWETRQWMAATPLSALSKLRPYQLVIEGLIAFLAAALLYLAYLHVQIAWVALPLAAWAGVLMLRPGLPDARRAVLFMIGTALLLTIAVEVIVLVGDIGRMNTVFKLYLQAWTLLALSAAAAFGWVLGDLGQWRPRWRSLYQSGVTILLAGAFLFTVSATMDKVSDRMAPAVPLTLDSMSYMQYAHYADFGAGLDLSQDYRAIRWMQDNVQGSPVIVEANCPEYRWCSRYTIYTGLPGVVGWNWHQRQQRALVPPNLITDRVDAIAGFYTTTDIQAAQAFLRKYEVQYIVVGQLERAEYGGAGLDKFEQYDGRVWSAVYRDGETVIYRVLP